MIMDWTCEFSGKEFEGKQNEKLLKAYQTPKKSWKGKVFMPDNPKNYALKLKMCGIYGCVVDITECLECKYYKPKGLTLKIVLTRLERNGKQVNWPKRS
jgi:hypothetical protein